MTLVKVARPRINRSFDHMLSNFFEDMNFDTPRSSLWRPAMDAIEAEKNFELSFSLPGFEKDDITVSVKNNTLNLKATKAEIKEDEGPKYLTREIARGSYERDIELPENVNTDKIAAEYKSGILTLSIPKTKEALPKEIAVTVK
ncbi:MAG: Hsp20/alpha crystallin family protein [FCB group bacterium]|nr:Hsp20/alpha crystallin family protein [FCB group bacterium]MBL7027793.1 Hsp20/alpha crystallin family protein [Candidatus Neomarinimicrobiota bacterium]MBL7120874.1 Hsp20/alpha crystallin family protein [Candidatus Neomarinimicrobiota bacterium]